MLAAHGANVQANTLAAYAPQHLNTAALQKFVQGGGYVPGPINLFPGDAPAAPLGSPVPGGFRQPSQMPREPLKRANPQAAYWGIDSGATPIGAGASATITVQPQKACVPITMSLSQAIADAFAIGAITVGVDPIYTTSGLSSAAIFVQNTTAPTFKRIFLQVGKNFSVTVTNVSGAGARFIATGIGEDQEPQSC